MSYEVKIIADSVNTLGNRLVTITAKFPRFILAEMNTHRDFSRNSASSRAVPVHKIIERVKNDPVIPVFLENQPGMQGAAPIVGRELEIVTDQWLTARNNAVNAAETMKYFNVHKQVANRLLEPFMWHEAIITSSRWNNFISQRCDPAAQPEMQKIAYMIRDAIEASRPTFVPEGEWHIPFIQESEFDFATSRKLQLSVARCARVSYLNHEGVRDTKSDFDLYKKLVKGNHHSPFEHQAQADQTAIASEYGNLEPGWHQLRKQNPKEYVI